MLCKVVRSPAARACTFSLARCPVAGLRLWEADPVLGLQREALALPALAPYHTLSSKECLQAFTLPLSPLGALPRNRSPCGSCGSTQALQPGLPQGALDFVVQMVSICREQAPSPAPSLLRSWKLSVSGVCLLLPLQSPELCSYC